MKEKDKQKVGFFKKLKQLKHFYLLLIIVISLAIFGLYFSYALFTVSVEKKGVLNVVTGNLYSYISSDKLDDNYRITVPADSSEIIDLAVENINSIPAKLNLYYKFVSGATDDVEVGYSLQGDTPPGATGTLFDEYGASSYTKNYRVVITNHSTSSTTIEFGSKVGLSSGTLTLASGEKTLTLVLDGSKANAPVLSGDMIPVVYQNNKWVKADTNNWYNYETQQWANAVTGKDYATRQKYLNAEPGTEVLMSDITTMWVWIPKFEYRIQGSYGLGGTSMQSPGEIEINFVSKETLDASDGFILHPAFCWGDTCNTNRAENKELAGIWVGKFETSPNEDSNCYKQSSTTNCNSYTLNVMPRIVPNAPSWRNVNVYVMNRVVNNEMNGSYGYSSYGFNGGYNVHVMKNSEWGAMAYLSQSKYGTYGGNNTIGNEICKNNSSSYYTGRSNGGNGNTSTSARGSYSYDGRSCTTNACNTESITALQYSTCSSTTGNISGIYDVVGGSSEMMMMNYNTTTSTYPSAMTSPGQSLFSTSEYPTNRYIDYIYSNNTSCGNKGNCFGHALVETHGWYEERTSGYTPSSSSYPWLAREGNTIFSFDVESGTPMSYLSFRLVLNME